MIKQPKRVELIDLLNDLQKEVEITKRIKENLKNSFDQPKSFVGNFSSFSSSSTFVISTTPFLGGL